MALIEMSGVTKKYRRSTTALRNLNLSIQQGEFVYLVGPSGAGKSSLIRLLYREEKLSSGRLKVGNSISINSNVVKFLFYVVVLELSSKIINYYQQKQFMRMLRLRCKLLELSAVILKNACQKF